MGSTSDKSPLLRLREGCCDAESPTRRVLRLAAILWCLTNGGCSDLAHEPGADLPNLDQKSPVGLGTRFAISIIPSRLLFHSISYRAVPRGVAPFAGGFHSTLKHGTNPLTKVSGFFRFDRPATRGMDANRPSWSSSGQLQ
jgi:hypothetical protein